MAEAERLLEKYAETQKCGWCRQKARKLRDATKQLREASPKAIKLTDDFKKELGDTGALDSVDEELEEIKSQAEKNVGFHERLNRVVNMERMEPPRRRKLVDESLPNLPPIVTPDEVGLMREEEMRRFREQSNRRTGPIREKIRFQVWKRLEKEGPLSRRNKVVR